MPRLLPPIDKRFPVNRPYAPNAGNKGPHLTTILRKLLANKKFRYEDPETQKIIKMAGDKALPLVYIWQALQGNVQAIEGIFDRIDGKLNATGNQNGNDTKITINIVKSKEGSLDTSPRVHIERASLAEGSQRVVKAV
jgi:hypothetical protein